jgi:hypothetical protein
VLTWLELPENQNGLERATDTTIRKWMKEVPVEEIARQEGGNRAYHRSRPPSDPRDNSLRGLIPGMYAHIDASQWDTRLWESLRWTDGLPCPWWLVAIDECGGRPIGLTIGLGKEDRFAVSLLMRDIGHTLGFMPHFTVSDRGAAYQSTWFQEFEGTMTMNGFDRSAGNPRSGSPVENPIGIFMKQLAHRLAGSTELDRAGRQVAGNKKSHAQACHTLATVNAEMRAFAKDEFCSVRHGQAVQTPMEIWLEARARFPNVGIPLPDPETWEVLLAIPIKEKVTVDLNKGIRTYYRTYRSSQLTTALRSAKPDDIRLSAIEPTVVFARFGRKWVRAFSQDHLVQSSLPIDHQSVELLLRRLFAQANVSARQKSAMRLDTRADELNFSAKAAKAAETSQPIAATPVGTTDDLFDTINWS